VCGKILWAFQFLRLSGLKIYLSILQNGNCVCSYVGAVMLICR
jgi:hypothetical protein